MDGRTSICSLQQISDFPNIPSAAIFQRPNNGPEKRINNQKTEIPLVTPADDLPGSLSINGPRHDNDHESIARISILPTGGEILSDRVSFRPMSLTANPNARHHLSGIQRLFDSQFRLLREDCIGCLKSAIRMVLDDWTRFSDPSVLLNRPKRTIQTTDGGFFRIYHHVIVSSMTFDRRNGSTAMMQFDQPRPANSFTDSKKRLQWWAQSKELQEGNLLALIGEDKEVVFLTVARRFVKGGTAGAEEDATLGPDQIAAARGVNAESSDMAILQDLAGTPTRSTVFLNLAEFDRTVDAMRIFNRIGHRSTAVLLEFPGVMAASFQAVLGCLQSLCVKPQIPFADWLQSSEAAPDMIKSPRYLAKYNTTLNLSCISDDPNVQLTHSVASPVDLSTLKKHTTLDEGQSEALLAALQRELALIQGPPGTGKSYVGVQIAKVLWKNKDITNIGPIICV